MLITGVSPDTIATISDENRRMRLQLQLYHCNAKPPISSPAVTLCAKEAPGQFQVPRLPVSGPRRSRLPAERCYFLLAPQELGQQRRSPTEASAWKQLKCCRRGEKSDPALPVPPDTALVPRYIGTSCTATHQPLAPPLAAEGTLKKYQNLSG